MTLVTRVRRPYGYVLATAAIGALLTCTSLAAAQAAPPRRIVSIVPAVTEILFAIGAGPSVVGVSSWDAYPPEVATRARVGALIDPDFERILSLKPDLVIVYGSHAEFMARLERAGIRSIGYRHGGLAEVTTTIRNVGDQVGRGTEARALARQIEADLSAVRSVVRDRPRPRTAILVARELGALRAMYASAGIGFLHDILTIAGGQDVFDDIKRESVQVSTEMLLARAPDVILEIYTPRQLRPELIPRELTVWKRLPSLPAVRAGRVHIVVDERLGIPGPRVAAAARIIAETLHPGIRW